MDNFRLLLPLPTLPGRSAMCSTGRDGAKLQKGLCTLTTLLTVGLWLWMSLTFNYGLEPSQLSFPAAWIMLLFAIVLPNLLWWFSTKKSSNQALDIVALGLTGFFGFMAAVFVAGFALLVMPDEAAMEDYDDRPMGLVLAVVGVVAVCYIWSAVISAKRGCCTPDAQTQNLRMVRLLPPPPPPPPPPRPPAAAPCAAAPRAAAADGCSCSKRAWRKNKTSERTSRRSWTHWRGTERATRVQLRSLGGLRCWCCCRGSQVFNDDSNNSTTEM